MPHRNSTVFTPRKEYIPIYAVRGGGMEFVSMIHDFLPVCRADMEKRGWDQLDFLLISGDAYVDHSSFGHAIIGRVLENAGLKVGIVAQPNWRNTDDFLVMGTPKYGVFIGSGNIDSMVNHYTAAKKRRSEDAYSPGGKAGMRPDRAIIVYSNRVREAFPKLPVVIGGIEASLRRFAHYDYWDDKVRRSVLVDSGADLLVYGMGETQMVEIAKRLKSGTKVSDITDIPGTCYLSKEIPKEKCFACFSFSEVASDKKKYAESFMIQYQNQDPFSGHTVVQKHGEYYLVQNKPAKPLTRAELDKVYSLPYMGTYHPMYEKDGGVPAIREVKFSLTSSRGCYGNCSFCALTFHQGRIITSRSQQSLIREAEKMVWDPDFKGYIHDVGGPTANFRQPSCEKQGTKGSCPKRQCLFPSPCENLRVDHREYAELLRKLSEIPRVKKVFVRSGIRYDYLIYDKDERFFRQLCEHHVSGQLKVAPEHVSEKVLYYMGKPNRKVFDAFCKKYTEINRKLGKEQYVVPYLMSSHPGSELKDAIELAEYLRDIHYTPEQVQDFYPTPGTMSTCMFYTGLDPRTMEKVYVPKSYEEKKMQRALLQYRRPENYEIVKKALLKAGRSDLIGFDKHCLIPFRPIKGGNKYGSKTVGRKESFGKNKERTRARNGKTEKRGDKSRSGGGHRRK